MRQFIAAGLVYLLGVAMVLVLKPTLMFTDEGDWKEFGIGRNVNTHTWMPFWFFAILWALTSYITVIIIFSVYLPQPQIINAKLKMPSAAPDTIDETVSNEFTPEEFEAPKPRRSRGKSVNLPDGYYLKNNTVTSTGNVPKYIYLGKNLPEDT